MYNRCRDCFLHVNVILFFHRKAESVIEAMYEGGMVGAKIVVNVIVSMLIYLAAFNFVNLTILWFSARVGQIWDLEVQYTCILSSPLSFVENDISFQENNRFRKVPFLTCLLLLSGQLQAGHGNI